MTNGDAKMSLSFVIRASDLFLATPVFVLPPLADWARMKLKSLFNRMRRSEAKVIVSFGEAHLLRNREGGFELRGGSRSERQAAREWVSFFKHDAAVEW